MEDTEASVVKPTEAKTLRERVSAKLGGKRQKEVPFADPRTPMRFADIKDYSDDQFQALVEARANSTRYSRIGLSTLQGYSYLRGSAESPIENDLHTPSVALLLVIKNELSLGDTEGYYTDKPPIQKRGLATHRQKQEYLYGQYSRSSLAQDTPKDIVPPPVRRIVNSKHDHQALLMALYGLSQLEDDVPKAIAEGVGDLEYVYPDYVSESRPRITKNQNLDRGA